MSQFLLSRHPLSVPPSVLTVLPARLSRGSRPAGKCSDPTQPWCLLPSMLLLFLEVLISGPSSPSCCGYSQLFSLPGPFRLVTGWNDSSSFWCSKQAEFSEILNFDINWCQSGDIYLIGRGGDSRIPQRSPTPVFTFLDWAGNVSKDESSSWGVLEGKHDISGPVIRPWPHMSAQSIHWKVLGGVLAPPCEATRVCPGLCRLVHVALAQAASWPSCCCHCCYAQFLLDRIPLG